MNTPLSITKLILLGLCCLMLSGAFVALGAWQLQRRVWKLELIERTTQRVQAPAVSAPGPQAWPTLSAANAEYRHVSVSGHFLHDLETPVQASTVLGSGYWVLTPLQTTTGFTVLINRGFVPPQRRLATQRVAAQVTTGEVTINGLLRISEPKGGFLRDNDVAANRWYSRDVARIAAARGLPAGQTAPYFIDMNADAGAAPVAPTGGLTVLSFRNQHLGYAMTWFALALMPAAFLMLTLRRERRLRQSQNQIAHD